MVKVSLALQGGGAHGAFTWGVLDRLLEDPDLEIAAISGTSAGALNGAALKAGLAQGGPDGARAALRALWEKIGAVGDFRVLLPWFQPFVPFMRAMQDTTAALMPFSPQGIAAQIYSPYAWGAQWQNPLEPVLRSLDFTDVCSEAGPKLFVGATNVRTGKARLFSGTDITVAALLASACLPSVFQAVEIDGESYWDGGYAGNPSLWPLFDRALPDDILIIHVNPLRRDEVPQTPMDIQDRVDEISFNATLLSELRAIAFVQRLIADGQVAPGQMKDLRVHLILNDALMNELSPGSKMRPSSALIERLFTAGRVAGAGFLEEAGQKIGKESSADLLNLFS